MRETIFFDPIAMERVWGGRRFGDVLGKRVPEGVPVGELWELVDRADAQSVVAGGALRGTTLNELWTRRRAEIFGAAHEGNPSPRFPILVKLLDAGERLSVQVHPPQRLAASLGGEPKTEVWYFLDSLPGARIYAGLRAGVTRESFEHALREGSVEDTLHSVEVRAGESIFIPSGRVHAIGGGSLIVEVQQNSDTTYRVFDWNRAGLDGKPRELHIAESLASIDFEDFEPGVRGANEAEVANCDFFEVRKRRICEAEELRPGGQFALISVVEGTVRCLGAEFRRGQFFLIPASSEDGEVSPVGGEAAVLVTTLPV